MTFDPTFTDTSVKTLPNRHVMGTWLDWISHKLIAFWWLKDVTIISLSDSIWSSSHFFLCLFCA